MRILLLKCFRLCVNCNASAAGFGEHGGSGLGVKLSGFRYTAKSDDPLA